MNVKKKILIVEDEFLIAEEIKLYLECLGYSVVGICNKLKNAIEYIEAYTPDLVLLDINLHGTESGIEIAKYIDSNFNIPFIYISSYSDRETLDEAKITQPKAYLVKPINQENLMSTLEVVFYSLSAQKQDLSTNHCFVGKDGTSIFKIPFYDIKWINSDKQYMEIYTEDKKKVVRMTMQELESALPEILFCRIHKSFIVNVDKVSELKSGYVYIGQHKIPIGRKYKQIIMDRLTQI